jgi:branched-chain amino acid transport system substrate-binding protein
VARVSFEPGAPSVQSQVVRLRASGANAFLILAIPNPTAQAMTIAYRIGWRPQLYVNSVSAIDIVFEGVARAAGSQDAVRGAISTAYFKDPANPKYNRDPIMRSYRRILSKYGPRNANPNNGLYFYGMAKAHTFVQTLYRAGRKPTRDSLRRAAENINIKSTWLLNNGRVRSSRKNPFPISTVRLVRWNGTHFEEFGPLIKTR